MHACVYVCVATFKASGVTWTPYDWLKGGGHAKIIADFFGQIFSLGSLKTENIIFKFFRIH